MNRNYLLFAVIISSIFTCDLLAQSVRELSMIEKILSQQRNGPEQPARSLNKTTSPTGIIYLPDTLISKRLTGSTNDSTRYSFSYNSQGLLTCGKIEKSGGGTSGKWVNDELDSCTYDTKGSRLSTLIKTWVNNQWTYSTFDSCIYTPSGKLFAELTASWINGKWSYASRTTNAYDTKGNLQTYYYEMGSNGVLSNLLKYDYTYDTQGNMLSQMNQQWINAQWTNTWRLTNTYDGKGGKLIALQEKWSNGKWVNSIRDSCTYDAQGNKLSSRIKAWSNGQWKDSTRQNSTYNANGKMLSDSCDTSVNSVWTAMWQNNYTYDSNGNRVYASTKDWKSMAGSVSAVWVIGQDSSTFDAKSRMLSEVCRTEWIVASNVYGHNSERITYSYDATGNLILFWHDMGPDHWPVQGWFVVINARTYPYFFFDYNNCVSTISYKQMNVTDVPTTSTTIVSDYSLSQNYPNPFNPSTTILFSIPAKSFVSLKIFDVIGREVATLASDEMNAGTHRLQWNAANMPSGVYFYRLQAGAFIETRKLLLIR